MTQFEFYKSFQFVWELMLSTLIYVYRLKRRKDFFAILPLCILACFSFAFLLPITDSSNPFVCSMIFILILVFMILISKLCFDESWTVLVFCCVAGYTTQHLCYELYSLIINVLGVNGDTPLGFYGDEFTSLFTNPFQLAVYAVVYTLCIFGCFLFFGGKTDFSESFRFQPSFIFFFSILILTIDIILNSVVIFLVPYQKTTMIVMGTYNILCCIVALYLQFEVALKRKLEITLEVERQIWRMSKEQYAVSKESIELINMKCHDLKHQIRELSTGSIVNADVLRDIEDSISIYDSVFKTGNDALDVILTEKSLLCNRYGIELACIIDGAKLSFMKDEDVYALFGNIIDNAIEAVMKLEADKRVLSLHIKQANGVVVINQFNTYADIIVENGVFRTTKSEREYHGYGLRSIKRICEEYSGDVTISTENNIFTLNIIFPVLEGQ